MKKVSNENYKEKSKHTFYAQKRFYESRAIYEIIWKYVVDYHTGHRCQYDMVHALCMVDN
jgi:hypothetical protein